MEADMTQNEFVVALFGLFFFGYVMIRWIFAIHRTGSMMVVDDEVDTTYHYNDEGHYVPDWADFDRLNLVDRDDNS